MTNIVSLRAAFHAQRIAENNAKIAFYSVDRIMQHIDKKSSIFKREDLIILGFYLRYKNEKNIDEISNIYKKLIKSHKRTVIIFAGSDAIHFQNKKNRIHILDSLKNLRYSKLAVGERLGAEVSALIGEEVKTLYLPFNHVFTSPEIMPAEFSVGCYMPTSRSDFYGYRTIIEAIKLCPNTIFHFYANDGFRKNEEELEIKNLICHHMPVIDMEGFFKNISCGIRLTEHDGNPMSLAEYCANGRAFLYNGVMPYCEKISNDSKHIVERIINLQNKYDRSINIDAVEFYKKRHDSNLFPKNLRMAMT